MPEPQVRHDDGLYQRVKALLEQDGLAEAMQVTEEALAAGREPALALSVMAALAYRTDALGDAIQLLLDLWRSGEGLADIQEALAVLYCQVGLLTDALYYGKEATISQPDGRLLALFGPTFPTFAQALLKVGHKPLMRRGVAALDNGDPVTAIRHLEQHLKVAPSDVEAIDHYARALVAHGQMAKALGMLRSLVTLGGAKPTLVSRLGACLMALGRGEQGLAVHRAAVAQAPNAIALWGELVRDLAYVPAGRSDAVALTAGWAACVGANAVKSPRPAPTLPGLDKLTVAVLCSGTSDPALLEMIGLLLEGWDRKRFTLLGLGNGELQEPHNVILRGVFDRWRNVRDLDVLTLGALIRGEGVALLLDADGLTQPGRAGLFLRKSASVQAAWLHAPVHGPVPGATWHLVSAPAGLPGEVVVPGGRYLLDMAPFSAGPAPSAAGAAFAFGADVSLAEVTPDTAALWSAVLAAIPDSMLVLRDRGQFAERECVDGLIELFGNHGVAHRVDVVAADQADFCRQVDVMLAPTPHFDLLGLGRSLLAGVPVVALAGGGAAADLSAALAGSAGHASMVAADVAAYVNLAQAWHDDRDKLAGFRVEPRRLLAGAVAFDRQAYVQAFVATVLTYLETLAG